ncbi:MAG TPA: hypothetical protein VEN31_07245 [Candidatus Bathyarchaeia archaeon]|nr:hypothetical protein [Candidatus Bathyarchaeia archaeon]
MRPYLSTARRYLVLLATILALVWGAGLIAAYAEYTTTYQATANVWVLRVSQDLAVPNPDDPNVPIVQTVAAQQAELLGQLLRTRSVLRDVVQRTSLSSALAAASDEARFLDTLGKRFKVQALGTNLLAVSYTARDPQTPAEMVNAALAVRRERVAQARVAGGSALSAFYRREFEIAQTQALEAQRQLDDFTAAHKGGELNADDAHQDAVLRLAVDLAHGRLVTLQSRIDQTDIAPALVDLSGIEFQVVDEARQDDSPSGGTRNAATLAGAAFVAGCALAFLFVLCATLLTTSVAGPADVERLAPATLFASVPRIRADRLQPRRDLRSALAASAFGDGEGREAWR